MSQWHQFNVFCVRWNTKSLNTWHDVCMCASLSLHQGVLAFSFVYLIVFALVYMLYILSVCVCVCVCVFTWHSHSSFLCYSLSRQGAQTVCIGPHGLTTPSPGWHCTQHSPSCVYWFEGQTSWLARAPTCQSPERSFNVTLYFTKKWLHSLLTKNWSLFIVSKQCRALCNVSSSAKEYISEETVTERQTQ